MTRAEVIEVLQTEINRLKLWDLYSVGTVEHHQVCQREISAYEYALATLRPPPLDENGLAPCGCGGKAVRASLPLNFGERIQYSVSCVYGCVYTGWLWRKEDAHRLWNQGHTWKERA